jgi:hypothetical protein
VGGSGHEPMARTHAGHHWGPHLLLPFSFPGWICSCPTHEPMHFKGITERPQPCRAPANEWLLLAAWPFYWGEKTASRSGQKEMSSVISREEAVKNQIHTNTFVLGDNRGTRGSPSLPSLIITERGQVESKHTWANSGSANNWLPWHIRAWSAF